MNRLTLIMLPSFVLVFGFCTQRKIATPNCNKVVSGFLYENENHTFHLQDHEDGFTYELKFENEIADDFSLDEFIFVEVSGQFVKKESAIIVDEILINDTDPLFSLAINYSIIIL